MLNSGLQVLGCNPLYFKNTIFLFCCKLQLLTKVKLRDNNVPQIRDPQDQSYWICSIHKKYCIYKNIHKLLSINHTTFTMLVFIVDLQNKYIIPAVLLIHRGAPKILTFYDAWKWSFLHITCAVLYTFFQYEYFSMNIQTNLILMKSNKFNSEQSVFGWTEEPA